ncbi:MAG: type IV secretion system DNA-binding domain-containing protein, partial [Nitrososphaerota archaeon]
MDENGKYRGIFKDERIHMAVVGFPGCGKSRFLLSLALQNVRDGEGLMIVDPHGDLAKIFLSHVPRHRWKDVVYIDPMTARNYGRVVKINFLECPDVKDRDVVARSFMESLEKIYAKFWGPRLDMILMNAVYALLDAGNTNLSMLYNVIADEQFRETLLEKVTDDKIKNFWRNEFKRMTKDASSAALTKIYRIVQERIVAPMFDCVRSKIDFRKAMDQRKIIVVNLSEGAITSDVANFLGSLILARVYLAGMSREDTPEEKRIPFYVYVDEAYRFVSLSIRDILQSLRKYRVYMTLASQYLGQYTKEIADSIPHLCDTIICFNVGEDTAKALEEFYRPSLTYLDLVHLPKFTFAASAMIGGSRECQVLRSVDCGWGPTNVEELIKFSLQNFGEEVDMAKYTGVPTVGSLPHPTNIGFNTPLPWAVLVVLNRLCEEDPKNRFISRDDLAEKFREYGVSDADIEQALRALSTKNYIEEKSYNYDHYYVPIAAEAPLALAPVTCIKCGQPTCRPFRVRGGTVYCRYCIEEAI